MDPTRIAIRAIVAFGFLLAMTRLSGKKTVSEATAFDFVLALILGDVTDDFLFAETTGSKFFGCVAALVLIDILLKMISSHSTRFELLIDGRASVLYQDGKPVEAEFKKQQMQRSDVASLLRIRGLDEESCGNIKKAVLENSGDLSVLKKHFAKPLQKQDAYLLPKKES